jgi:hypothetical protein
MPGPRQQQIVDALAAGSFSVSALLRHLGVGEPAERMVVLETVRTLAQRGLVRVVGRTGRSDLTGAVVELVKEGAGTCRRGRKASTGCPSARTRRRSPAGSAASGGWPAIPSPDAVTVLSDRLVFRPRLAPMA